MIRNQKTLECLLRKWYKRFSQNGRYTVPPTGKDSHNNYILGTQYQQIRLYCPDAEPLVTYYKSLGESAEYGEYPALDNYSSLVDKYSEENKHKVALPDKAGLKEYIKQHKALDRGNHKRTVCQVSLDGVLVNGEYLLEMMEFLPNARYAMVNSRRDPVVIWDPGYGDGLLMPIRS